MGDISWKSAFFWVGLVAGALVGIIVPMCLFATTEYSVVARNATEEQIMAVYDYSGGENTVWVNGVEKIYGDNSLVEILLVVRQSEKDEKIEEVMDYIGITDYAVGEASNRR
jgi:hypothetical protein